MVHRRDACATDARSLPRWRVGEVVAISGEVNRKAGEERGAEREKADRARTGSDPASPRRLLLSPLGSVRANWYPAGAAPGGSPARAERLRGCLADGRRPPVMLPAGPGRSVSAACPPCSLPAAPPAPAAP